MFTKLKKSNQEKSKKIRREIAPHSLLLNFFFFKLGDFYEIFKYGLNQSPVGSSKKDTNFQILKKT